ncbi:RNase adapter RapZ [Acidisphaera sp. S103]|uniref:RNase adapter RapZ n=1 Tax=Acidisphaera sp. S103 TaxID=1747223 RepID=UPI00131DCE09|nr:RNase adapter RapZ [Acidisphaera sp. S103]
MSSLAVVIVSGLSGGGKASILRALEDVGYEAVDNPPLTMLEEMICRGDRKLAVGIDARTRGFDANDVLNAITRLQTNPGLRIQLVYAWADDSTLLRRYTETRRRHPLAPQGVVADGIAAEVVLTEPLREHADLVVDTSGLPIANLRRLIERYFGAGSDQARMVVSLVSFAYPKGLPREADLVFDARFLRNPHYDPILRPKTGMDRDVAAYIKADPDFAKYFSLLTGLVELALPRFVQEGKRYATITIGCTGGRHRSVYLIEKLAKHLTSCVTAKSADRTDDPCWQVFVTHRELASEGNGNSFLSDRPVARRDESDLDRIAQGLSVQA